MQNIFLNSSSEFKIVQLGTQPWSVVVGIRLVALPVTLERLVWSLLDKRCIEVWQFYILIRFPPCTLMSGFHTFSPVSIPLGLTRNTTLSQKAGATKPLMVELSRENGRSFHFSAKNCGESEADPLFSVKVPKWLMTSPGTPNTSFFSFLSFSPLSPSPSPLPPSTITHTTPCFFCTLPREWGGEIGGNEWHPPW